MMDDDAFEELWEQLVELGLEDKVLKNVVRHTCNLRLAAIKIPILFF